MRTAYNAIFKESAKNVSMDTQLVLKNVSHVKSQAVKAAHNLLINVMAVHANPVSFSTKIKQKPHPTVKHAPQAVQVAKHKTCLNV